MLHAPTIMSTEQGAVLSTNTTTNTTSNSTGSHAGLLFRVPENFDFITKEELDFSPFDSAAHHINHHDAASGSAIVEHDTLVHSIHMADNHQHQQSHPVRARPQLYTTHDTAPVDEESDSFERNVAGSFLDNFDDDTASEPVSPFFGPSITLHGTLNTKWSTAMPDVIMDAPAKSSVFIDHTTHLSHAQLDDHLDLHDTTSLLEQQPMQHLHETQSSSNNNVVTNAIITTKQPVDFQELFLDDGVWPHDILGGPITSEPTTLPHAPGTDRRTTDNPVNADMTRSTAYASARPRRSATMRIRRAPQRLVDELDQGDGALGDEDIDEMVHAGDDDDDEDFDLRRKSSSRKRVRSKRTSVKKRRRSCASDWSASSRGQSANVFEGQYDSACVKKEASMGSSQDPDSDELNQSLDDCDRHAQIVQFLERVQQSGSNAVNDDEEVQSSKKRKYKCTHVGCPRTFLWKWAMEEHAATHMPDKGRVHECTFCSKSFFTIGCLKSHVRIHTRKPYSYVCKAPGCTKKYCTSEGLRLHTRNVHEADKKWKCPSDGCFKSFVRQSDLRLHIIRIHSKERPYPCTLEGCEKSFACYSELKRHLTSHKDAKCAVDAALDKAEASHRAFVASRS